MREATGKEAETYTRLSKAIRSAIQPGDDSAIVCSVLLKHLISLVIHTTKQPEKALEVLSGAINECFEDLKKEKII
jgi:hypothetical protein